MKKLVWVSSMAVAILVVAQGCVLDPTYTYCGSSSECHARETCFEIRTSETAGAFCSEECTADSQCERNLGFRGSCMVADALGGICFQECEIHADCFSTSGCYDYTDSDGFTNRVCLPETL